MRAFKFPAKANEFEIPFTGSLDSDCEVRITIPKKSTLRSAVTIAHWHLCKFRLVLEHEAAKHHASMCHLKATREALTTSLADILEERARPIAPVDGFIPKAVDPIPDNLVLERIDQFIARTATKLAKDRDLIEATRGKQVAAKAAAQAKVASTPTEELLTHFVDSRVKHAKKRMCD